MQKWVLYALISSVFAGITSVIAKVGLKEINPTLALGIRTVFIFIFISVSVAMMGGLSDLKNLSTKSLLCLIASAITTSLSWLFYYHAMKEGKVSVVASIDKCSIVITLLLSFFILQETFTWKLALGVVLILCGLFVLL